MNYPNIVNLFKLLPQDYIKTIDKEILLETENNLNNEIKKSKNELELIYPNIVTADGDGINDDFRLLNSNTAVVQAFENFSCKIFSRWGQEQGEFNDVLGFWDPSDFNTGTYFYIVEYSKIGSNEVFKYEGAFYLKR